MSFKTKEHIKVILLGDSRREMWSLSLRTWKRCPFVPMKKDALHIQSLIQKQKDTEVRKQSWNQAHRMLLWLTLVTEVRDSHGQWY